MKEKYLSLYEINNLVKGVLQLELSSMYWVVAETSDVRANQNGHCYMELIQKDSSSRNTLAKAKAMIWGTTFNILRPYFESSTGQRFASGLKILIQVSVNFHELYGYSLTIHDIDPSYTLGDQAQKRATIIKRLEEEGVLTLNKELVLPRPLQRIAIISSPTAAGYEDFCNQLDNNPFGLVYYYHLFPTTMQGDRTEQSVIQSLDQIYVHSDLFDAVVIIRGGGATSELTSFDSYLLVASCAQFPLPIIVGIGHERDETVLDLIAHTKAKTPTAVAEFLININLIEINNLSSLIGRFKDEINRAIRFEEQLLKKNQLTGTLALRNIMQQQRLNLDWVKNAIVRMCINCLSNESSKVNQINKDMAIGTKHLLKNEFIHLDSISKHLELLSPENLLRKGYTYTLKNNKLVNSKELLEKGDEIKTIFPDGDIYSIVK